MGGAIAANLQRSGHELRVHDLDRQTATTVLAKGAVWLDSPARAADEAEVVFTCLPGPAEVESVANDPKGLLAGMRSGSVWFDLTTNSPEVARRLHSAFGTRGIPMLDAPISGGPQGAQVRKLAIWVGGDESVFKRCLPVLKAIGDEPLYVGPIGSGCVAKLVHNCASFTIQNALAEAFTLGVKAGLDPLLLFKALRQGTTGRSRTFDRLAEHFLPNDYEPPKFALRLAYKDMSLALALASSQKVPMPFAETVMKDMREAIQRGWGDRDARVAMALQPERAGISVQVPRDQLRNLVEMTSGSTDEPVSAPRTKFEDWV
jgi:3-hydroxyisobutyrate dehydrogenase-like beta-hydroxyacid dehydrogenase